jgi:hypothetical protein
MQHRHQGKLVLNAGVGALAFATLLLVAGNAKAAYKIGDDESYLTVGGLLQFQGAITEKGAPNGDSFGTEMYLRRMRLMFSGQLNKWVNFFIETDNPNFGKNGDYSVNTFIQDAYLELNLHEAIQVDFGMLLLPFSHHGTQGATSLLGLDYQGALFKYPANSNKVWRDYGIMVRGMPFGKWLEYRLGVFNGVRGNSTPKDITIDGVAAQEAIDPRNPNDQPRFTGRLVFNVFDAEGGPGLAGMFSDGLYIKKDGAHVVSTKRVLSIGGSFDMQNDLNVTWAPGLVPPQDPGQAARRRVEDANLYYALSGDVFWDQPFGANNIMSVNGQVNFYYYEHGDNSTGRLWASGTTGMGLMSELGFRYDAIQPLMIVNWFNATKNPSGELADRGDLLGIHGGLNYYLFSHNVNFKLQFGAEYRDGSDDPVLMGLFQAQLLY